MNRVAAPPTDDRGISLIEVLMGSSIAMIALALVGTLLVSAQKQERVTRLTGITVDTARHALVRVADDIREAESLTADGDDAIAWHDLDGSGLPTPDELQRYTVSSVGEQTSLVRETTTGDEVLLQGISGATLTVTETTNGATVTLNVVVPGLDAQHAGTTVQTEVSTRGNG